MRRLFAKPHLFISYSRKDHELADYLYRSLTSAGFSVYYDKEKTLIGENFALQIQKELRRSDAVVAIVSINSAESPWCQAELYHARALNILITPIRVGLDQFSQVAPLDLMMKDISYVPVSDESSYPQAASQIQQQLKGIRRRAHLRNIRNGLAFILVIGLLIVIWRFGFQTLNNRVKAAERQAMISRLRNSDAVLTKDVLSTYAREFAEDEETTSQLLMMAANTELSDNARLNAQLLSAALLAGRQQQKRWYVKDINWKNSTYEYGQLSDVTFMKGALNNVQFKAVSFSGVVWNQAPSPQSSGLTLSNVEFEGCAFEAGSFGGTNAVGTNFINSTFRGTTFDVTGFAAVHFLSKQSDPTSSVITNEITVFENCSIQNCVPPSDPKTIEILEPDSEVRFTDVVFANCQFSGLIRPTWFKNCHFTNCVFPKTVSQPQLEAGGNTVENMSNAAELCN
jgi:uncharacterized protein YjbI with pentapeptide repeats